MSVVVQSLSKVYGTQRAVDNISFSLKKGEIVGFLGPNGAGKSTTMKMITGYLQPATGTATVCGIDVVQDALAVKRKIGYLPESNPLYYDMYVKEYLAFIAGVHQLAQAKQHIADVIALTGLQVEQHKKLGQLSKGYKQRAGLAAALIHQPEVLILDEPTTGLDPNQIQEIRQVIKAQGANKTVLFSSHILQEVQAICDRIIIINKGKIVADDYLTNLQQQQQQVVQVGFAEALEAEWLQRLVHSRNVHKLDTHRWQIETDAPDQLRKELLELALAQQFNITSLQTAGLNLEEVFRQLTSQA